MTIKVFDRVKQRTATPGTGTVALSSLPTAQPYINFSDVFSDGDRTFYAIENETLFEVGIGTYSGNSLTRDQILKSSNSDQHVSWPGDPNTYVFVTYPAPHSVFIDHQGFITGTNGYYTGIAFTGGDVQYIAYTGQEANVEASLNIASGYLQSQISTNQGDISSLSGYVDSQDTILSGLITSNSGDLASLSGYVDSQDSVLDSKITIVSGLVIDNSNDILTLSGYVDSQDSTISGNLQSEITANNASIITVSGLLYNYWTLAVDGLVDNITSTEQVTLTGIGGVEITYNSSTNTVTFSGVDPDLSPYATITYVDSEISNLSGYVDGKISNLSGYVDSEISDVDNNVTLISGVLQGQINNNDIDITTLSGLITDNDADISSLSGDVTSISGNLQSDIDQNTSDIASISGDIPVGANTRVAFFGPDNAITDSPNFYFNSGTSRLNILGSQIIDGTGASQKVLIVQGADGQTAVLQEWQDSSGNQRAYVDAEGNAYFGNITATGDLVVTGTLTYINSTNVTIADKQIELASSGGSAISGDLSIDEGGILLKSTDGDKEWIWDNATKSWKTNQNIYIANSQNLIFTDGSEQSTAYTGQEVDVSGNLQSQIDNLSGSVGWNISVTGVDDAIDSGDTLEVTGVGLSEVQYDPLANLLTVSGKYDIFTGDLTVSLSNGKTFGRYEDGDTIPASGKTAREVLSLAIVEPIAPTVNLSSSSTVEFNDTSVDITLNYNYTINSLNASVDSVSLEWRRGGVGSWNVLSTNTTTPGSFNHTFTDAPFNSSGINYRYIVNDTAGGTATGTLTINPESYQAPSISLSVVGNSISSPESNLKRERGNVDSNISATITRNSPFVDLVSYEVEYRVNSGSWQVIDSGSIGPGSDTIASSGHNPTSDNTASSLRYRVKIIDEYQQHLSSQVYSSIRTINFLYFIFYGAVASEPTTSSDVRAITDRIFTDGSNPFDLETGSTLTEFSVAMPDTLDITQVIDLDALNADITSQYINNPFNVDDAGGNAVGYNVYTMSVATPYSSSHTHRVTRG